MRDEATMDEMNMAMNKSRYAHDDKLHVEFYYKPRIDHEKTEEAGHPVYKDVLYARVTPPGGQTVDQPINDLTRKRFAARIAQWEAMNKEGDGIVGFRLEEWPQITRSQVEMLKYQRIHTVEQLAETSDGNLQTIMGGMGLKQQARDYLEKANGTEAQLQKMAARIAELEAATAEAPKRRGRPAKTAESNIEA